VNKNTITLNFILFISFLVVGYSVSTKFYHSDYIGLSKASSLMITSSSNSIKSLNNGQRNILLIGVNSIGTSETQLESIWLVTYLPSDPTLRMFPVFPAGNETFSDFENQLYQSFDLDNTNDGLVLGQEFNKVLENNNFWWSGYFILDHVAMTEVLNLFKETAVKGEISSKKQLIQEIPQAIDDPRKAFSIQLAIMQTACKKLSGLTQNPDWSLVTPLIPTHILTDMDFHQFMLEWEASFSSGQSPTCRFPTLELSGIDN
jgi:hypothetical protein